MPTTRAATAALGIFALRKAAMNPRPTRKMKAGWIDATLLRDFEAEGTDAHRLATIDDGWVERFGRDITVSFKTLAARDQLVLELHLWGAAVGFKFGRIFSRFLPR